MYERQLPGMQGLTLKPEGRRAAVQAVSYQRMPDMGQVNTNLVGAARMQTAAHSGIALGAGQGLDIGAGLPAPTVNRHARTRSRVTAYWRVHCSVPWGHHSVHQRHVQALDFSGSNGAAQDRDGLQGLAHHHQP
jgi:hypothetical protein